MHGSQVIKRTERLRHMTSGNDVRVSRLSGTTARPDSIEYLTQRTTYICRSVVDNVRGKPHRTFSGGVNRCPDKGDRLETPNCLPTRGLIGIVSTQHCVKSVSIDYYLKLLWR